METLVAEVASVHFTNEGKGTVEVGIPSYRASGEKCDGRESRARIRQRLQPNFRTLVSPQMHCTHLESGGRRLS